MNASRHGPADVAPTAANLTTPERSEAGRQRLVAVGDRVKKDQGLVTLESDKATMEVPSSVAGVVRELKVKVGDTYCPIVGRVCMDQFMVLLPKEVPAGTPVELISADPAAPNSLRRAADWLDTIHYEVACQFNDRLDRIYDNE